MANPQCENGCTQIASELLDVALRCLSAEELTMWLAVMRVTSGNGRTEAEISREQLAAMCGLRTRATARVLAALVARGVLYVKRNGPKPATIALENDFTLWVKKADRFGVAVASNVDQVGE